MSNVWVPDLGDGTYKNPIIFADYSDPDVIRVDDDYFMVASSFNLTPCMPVLHSKDLVNWKIVNHVSETFPFPEYDVPQHGKGIWAPSIRYHDGEFFVFVGAPDEGILMSKTTDPFGKWSPFHMVKKVKGWIDPCPFWDDDGQAYLVNAFAKSRIGFKSIIHVSRMKPDGTALLDEGVHVFDGNLHHETIEGPKMYKRNGYYYIFAPAGGVKTGWQTILRSKSIFGPYEDKIVLHQGSTSINGPHQGGWIDTVTGEDWFIHFQDRGAYGRITHLQPMYWENDWPVMGTNVKDGLGEPVLQHKKPNVGTVENAAAEPFGPQTSDDFDEPSLGLQWQWQANQKPHWYEMRPETSQLRLFAIAPPVEAETLLETPNVLSQKFPAPSFQVTVKLHFQPETAADRTGLVVTGAKYAGLVFKSNDIESGDSEHSDSNADRKFAIYRLDGGKSSDGSFFEIETFIANADVSTIYFRVTVTGEAKCQLSYSADGRQFHDAGESFEAVPGDWIGSTLGLFCVNRGEEKSSGYVDIDWFKVTQVE